jgi:uncharacterized protein YlbG (UPF0298 family)
MARARNIKPAFFQNEKLAELEPVDRLAFIALWTVCDFKGCLEYRPKRLKVQLLPYDNIDIEQTILNLEESDFIRIYSVEGQDYIKIVNFEKHQNPHKNEKEAGSAIPDYQEQFRINTDFIGTTRADSLNLIPDSLIPISDSSEKRVLKELLEKDFDAFWNVYPRKDKKEEAKKSWNKIRPNIEVVIQALEWQKQLPSWFEKDGKFIPMASTYLNQKRYLDEQPVRVTF